MSDTSTPRQLILLCDGTNNNLTGGEDDTNLVKLAELLARSPDAQRVLFYDPGVGNPGELPGATLSDQVARVWSRVTGLAFGRGVFENIAEGYRFLMRHWQPGDQIFVFGFSRGAFTARSIAGLVNQFGILQPQMETLVDSLVSIYFSERSDQKWRRIAAQARRLFAPGPARTADIHFVGVWDTVATVGMPPFRLKITAGSDVNGKSYVHVRQALALDEHRAQFQPRLYAQGNGPITTRSGKQGSLVQLWFRGAHCDVGGGYTSDQAVLSDHAFAWLVSEAVRVGLRLGPEQAPLNTEAAVFAAVAALPPAPPEREATVHSELHGNGLWALTGMTVRDTTTLDLEDTVDARLDAHEHPAVARPAAPLSSVWRGPRKSLTMWFLLLTLPFWMLMLGQLLYGAPNTGSMVGDLQRIWADWPRYLKANLMFQGWQLMGANPLLWPKVLAAFDSARWALLWELGYIACYAYVLAWWASRAFARRAGLRRAGQPVPRGLMRLGWALPLLVGGDLMENLLSWATLTLHQEQLLWPAMVTAVAMSVASCFKLAGLAGTLWLIVLGFGPSRPLPRAPAPPSDDPAIRRPTPSWKETEVFDRQ